MLCMKNLSFLSTTRHVPECTLSTPFRLLPLDFQGQCSYAKVRSLHETGGGTCRQVKGCCRGQSTWVAPSHCAHHYAKQQNFLRPACWRSPTVFAPRWNSTISETAPLPAAAASVIRTFSQLNLLNLLTGVGGDGAVVGTNAFLMAWSQDEQKAICFGSWRIVAYMCINGRTRKKTCGLNHSKSSIRRTNQAAVTDSSNEEKTLSLTFFDMCCRLCMGLLGEKK